MSLLLNGLPPCALQMRVAYWNVLRGKVQIVAEVVKLEAISWLLAPSMR